MNERIPTEEFLHHADNLASGETKRVDHICGGGKTMIVTHQEGGISAHCFRCNMHGFHVFPQPSLAERLKRRSEKQEADAAVEREVRLPAGGSYCPKDWPHHAKVWLYKAGLSNDVIVKHGIYYHPATDRVVLPVTEGERLVYWQARGFDKHLDKYLNPKVADKPLAVYRGHLPCCVVTEDLLSAIRVNGAGYSAACPLGTSLSDSQALRLYLHALAMPVAIWLDPDVAGRRASRKFARQLSLMGAGAHVREIKTDKDPKYYSDQEIKEILQCN